MKTKLLYLLIALSCCLQKAGGQNKQATASIQMRSEVTEGKALIRWAPTEAKAWRLLNKYGVRLERLTLVRGDRALETPEKTVLAECLKPEESEAFKQIAGQYSYGAIIAQAIFGNTFEVSGSGQYDVATVIALGQELQQRYVFSLYAADLCFPAAVVAGWGWEDTSVREDERYLYTVIPLVPTKEMKITEGSLFVDMGKKVRLPKPLDFRGKFADSSVLLNWNYRTMEKLYNAYIPERSTDGIHFTPISETPITQMESAAVPDKSDITYADSIENGITYYYRVAGLTPFGSKGAYSDTISGMGITELKDPPFITKAFPNANGGADIEWAFDPENEKLISDFTLERSDDDKGNYQPLISGIKKTERRITLAEIQSTNYFVVTANSLTGKKLRSFSALVQAIDTIPPAVPTGLVAKADTSGVVYLSWQPNQDADMYGYRIYRGQTAGEELIPLNDIAIRETAFADTIDLESLNTKVYYAVTALDERYNQSEPCPVIEVKKPERIAPTPPLIRNITVENGKNTLHWVSGQENTLAGYDVYRKSGQSKTFELLASVAGKETYSYEDTQVENNRTYVYQVKSRTEGGLISDPSPNYQVKAINKTESRRAKGDLTLVPLDNRIRINWKVTTPDVTNIQLYKKTGAEAFQLFRDGLETTGEIIDTNVLLNMHYQFMLVVKSNNAAPATLTKSIAL